MENAEKKLRDLSFNDSSNDLADWLFKYKLENISYLSSSPVQPLNNKTPRKGSTGLQPFDYRDIIRPTVQLFKNIRPKNKKRNDASPSPQRKKIYVTPSPTKESNKIFNHKGSSVETLENYRKLYTYARVKQDKVSREKIESAVALFRQREQEKESSSAIKNLSEKLKKVEQNGKAERKIKIVRFQDKNRKEARDTANSQKEEYQSFAVGQAKVAPKDEKINETMEMQRGNTKYIMVDSRERFHKNNLNSNVTPDLIITDYTLKDRDYKGDGKEQFSRIKNNGKMKNLVIEDVHYEDKKLNSQMGNKDKMTYYKDKMYGKINRPEKIDTSNSSSKRYLINSYNNLTNNKDPLEAGHLPVIFTRRNVHMQLRNYITIKPALQEEANGTFRQEKNINIGKTKSIDDLLQEYRLKYRNMIKLK